MNDKHQEIDLIAGLLKTKVLKLNSDTSFEAAVLHLGQSEQDHIVVVEEGDKPLGIVRSQDLIQALVKKHPKAAPISDLVVDGLVMEKAEATLKSIADLMIEKECPHVLVQEDEAFIGQISWQDVQSSLQEGYAYLEDKNIELSSKVSSMDDYLGVVSHDVRTPLSVISLCCDYLSSDASTKTMTPDQQSFIERIARNCKNASDLVSDLLDIVRLEKGFGLHYEDVDVDQFLGEVISNLQVIASDKHIEVVVQCEEHIHISMDPKRMIHVLENLVNNAVKFSPQGKKIFVTAGTEQRGAINYLALSVRDEGEGIREEDSEKIFSEFSQLETGVAKTLGIGLGLSIAKKFVSLHQGIMEVDGGWQKGATFKVLIPGAFVGAKGAEGLSRSGLPIILLVEDDDSIREYFQEELSNAGYDVILAGDGIEGLHAYFRYRPKLIISDIRMPNSDGLELLAKVRMTDKDVPFLLCTGYYPGLSEDLAASEYAANQVIEKPADAEDVVSAVKEHLKLAESASK